MNIQADLLTLYKTSKQTALQHPVLRKCCPDEWLEINFDFLGAPKSDGFAPRKTDYLLYGIVTSNALAAEGLHPKDVVVLNKYQKPKPNDKIVVKSAAGISIQKIIKQGSYRYAKALRDKEHDLGCLWRENFIGVIVKVVPATAVKKG